MNQTPNNDNNQNNNGGNNGPRRPQPPHRRPGGFPPRGGRSNGIFIYIAVLVGLVLIASFTFGMGKKESQYKYSDIVALFDDHKVTDYTFDLGTGDLTFTLSGEK
ncbi:MAG: hypothetical protein J6A76_05210, partial [Oscillospiraceae bacterium]|nr:hypothetical protein [Oscillospiraceae bacterium]